MQPVYVFPLTYTDTCIKKEDSFCFLCKKKARERDTMAVFTWVACVCTRKNQISITAPVDETT